MKRFLSLSILTFLTFLAAYPVVAFADGKVMWGSGALVRESAYPLRNIGMVPDGYGGAIIVWQEECSGAPIFAQRIDKDGMRLWGTNGVVVHTATDHGHDCPVVVGDGFGGAIIAWEDYYYPGVPNIYALRISSDTGGPYAGAGWDKVNGTPLVSNLSIKQMNPEIVSDGQEGAVVVWWEKDDMKGEYLIHGQRVEGDGTLAWGESGKVVDTPSSYNREFPKIVNDGMGNVFVTWQLNWWSGGVVNYDILVHKLLLADGTTSWSNLKQVTNKNTNETLPEIIADGQGGVVITWIDERNGTTNIDIYAQRIDSDGNPKWAIDGEAICDVNENQINPVITTTLLAGTTQFIIAWEDERNTLITDMLTDIYAEKIELYAMPGEDRLIAGGLGPQLGPKVVGDNQGGGIGCWLSEIGGSIFGILAQRYSSDGYRMWSYDLPVCSNVEFAGGYQNTYRMVSDGSEGVIIAWISSVGYRIYAQRVIEGKTNVPSASISGMVMSACHGLITGVEVEALKDDVVVSSDFTDNGDYKLTNLESGAKYEVRATWTVNDIVSSISMETIAPDTAMSFLLEIDYYLATILGNVSGVEREAKRVSGAGFKNSLSPGNGIAFVELEQRDKVIARVPVEMDGSYTIPNLLPGRFIARAYNGTIYSNPRTLNLKEGETLRVNFVFGIIPKETVYNYPNPAKSGSTTIRYYCGYSDPEAEIEIYNINGELVKTVKDSEIDKTDAPIYKFLWNCKNDSEKEVASGIYIYMVEVKEKSNGDTKKVIKRMAVIR